MADSPLSPIEDIIEDARNGRMYILVDAEDRENEGDLIIPAQFATPDAINFMARNGRGLICLALPSARARALGLRLMSAENRSRHKTAFTVSIEACEGITTGISAHDRAHTVAVAIDPARGAADIVSPGHVFPLVARDGGVLVRAGHTEAAVDISRMAGLNAGGVICEIMKDDGTMARLPDLVAFAQLHGLKIGTIADLIAYRHKHDRFVEQVVKTPFKSRWGGPFDLYIYRNTIDNAEHVALVKGTITGAETVLVRMHKTAFLPDIAGQVGARSDLVEQAIKHISAAKGPGVIVFIRETDNAALSRSLMQSADADKAKDQQNRRLREYGVGAQILSDLGVSAMTLLSNTPQTVVGLDGYGLTITDTLPMKGQKS